MIGLVDGRDDGGIYGEFTRERHLLSLQIRSPLMFFAWSQAWSLAKS